MSRWKRPGIILLITAVLLLILYFCTRNFFLHKVVDHVTKKLKEDYNTELSISEIHFSGFAGINVHELLVVPDDGDTLLTVDSMYVQPSLFALLTGSIRLKQAEIKNVKVSLSCIDSVCNYSVFLKKKKREEEKVVSKKDYGSLVNRLVTKAFDFAPQRVSLQNIQISYQKENKEEHIVIPYFISSSDQMNGTLINLSDSSQWNLSGLFSQHDKTIDVEIFPVHPEVSKVPILKTMLGGDCRFDTIHVALKEYRHSGDHSELLGEVSADNFFIQHPKISDEAVGVKHAEFDFDVKVGKNFIELDSSSSFMVNEILVHPFIKYESGDRKTYDLKINLDKLPATDFFNSLPSGMFDEVSGVEADGTLQFALNFHLDSSQPDNLVFDASLKKEKFRLKKFGKESLLKMNDEFVYSVYEHDRFVRTFPVGPSNPEFTPMDRISPYFRNAVLTSEDGSFFFHNGFNEDAFRKSIAANYKAGKFVRGGSTISMQLVKNVFLNRHKTVARKVEEALIVWLIENNRLCSKERMFEVYVNIVELGPNIYGIGEASRFYFNKKPAELTLAESVFLASLLPHPKWFKYSFDEQGNLKPYFADYYRVVANFLLKKNLINQDEYDHLQPHIELKGPAKEFLTPKENLPNQEEESSVD